MSERLCCCRHCKQTSGWRCSSGSGLANACPASAFSIRNMADVASICPLLFVLSEVRLVGEPPLDGVTSQNGQTIRGPQTVRVAFFRVDMPSVVALAVVLFPLGLVGLELLWTHAMGIALPQSFKISRMIATSHRTGGRPNPTGRGGERCSSCPWSPWSKRRWRRWTREPRRRTERGFEP